MPSLRYYNLMT